MAKKKSSSGNVATTSPRHVNKKSSSEQQDLGGDFTVAIANTNTATKATSGVRANQVFDVESIGYTAGEVWHLLCGAGDVPLATLKKQVDAPADLVIAALGWLAREGKLIIEPDGRTIHVRLCE